MIIHPIAKSIFMYYKFYPMIYLFVCAYHVYNYYEYTKVIAHYIKLISGKREPPNPKEEDYEWVMIEEEILDDDDIYFDLHMMVLITDPEPGTPEVTLPIEGEVTDIDFIDIHI